mmetsp:Transcript_18253/g.40364  ORF Transcript_18253/g.40364 Transcript_18253/m.40364 type:complete len:243 (-) Transcript_18253:2167-2895(-)
MILEDCYLFRHPSAGGLESLLPHSLIQGPNSLRKGSVSIFKPQHRSANLQDIQGAGARQDPVVRPSVKIASLGLHGVHDFPDSLRPLVAHACLKKVVEHVDVRGHTVLAGHFFNKTKSFFQLSRSREQLHTDTESDLSGPNLPGTHVSQQPNPDIEGSFDCSQRPAAAIKQNIVGTIVCEVPYLIEHRQSFRNLASVTETLDYNVVRYNVAVNILLPHSGQKLGGYFHLPCARCAVNHDVVR